MPVGDDLACLGRTLALARRVRGWTQAELARRAGVQSQQVSRYESGQVLPQLEQLARILDALGIDLVDLGVLLQTVRRILARLETPGQAPVDVDEIVKRLLDPEQTQEA